MTTPAGKVSSKLWKLFARNTELMKKFSVFQKELFLTKTFVWTCTKMLWQTCRDFVAENTKTFPNSKNVEVTIFWTKLLFFYQKRFLSNRECTFDNHTKKFLRKNTDLPLTFQKMTRKFMNYSKEKSFSSNCSSVHLDCSCDNPVKTFSSKLWKLFAGIPEMPKKW